MIPSTPSNHQLEDGEQPNPDSSKVTSIRRPMVNRIRIRGRMIRPGIKPWSKKVTRRMRTITSPLIPIHRRVLPWWPNSYHRRNHDVRCGRWLKCKTPSRRRSGSVKKDPPILPEASASDEETRLKDPISACSTTTSTRWATSPLRKSGGNSQHRQHPPPRCWARKGS